MTIATHAWVEVLLPELGWVGVDPTNGIEAGLRHIRVGVGRDYADVPPTRGVFKGAAASSLEVVGRRRARRGAADTRPGGDGSVVGRGSAGRHG